MSWIEQEFERARQMAETFKALRFIQLDRATDPAVKVRAARRTYDLTEFVNLIDAELAAIRSDRPEPNIYPIAAEMMPYESARA
jgi:hypothetical protein